MNILKSFPMLDKYKFHSLDKILSRLIYCNFFIKLSLVIVISWFSTSLFAQILDVHITNIRNTKGQLCLAIFADEAGFKAERTCWEMKCNKKDFVNGEFEIIIPFKQGKWAFSVLDDENESGKMEYKLLTIPREGFGFSNYYHKGINHPNFNDFSFYLKKNETKIITIRMKYY